MDRGVGYPDSVIGSGFFVDHRGYVLTNYHIIESEVNPKYEGFSRLYIRPASNENIKVPAKVVGWDSVLDVALLKAEIETEYVYPINSKVTYRPGDTIYAIGSPGGLRNTVTSGIVSATGRRFLQMGSTVQVDVPVNPGNSGGPLVDSKGRLIGVIFAGIEQFEGINFAIPTKWIVHVLPELFDGGQVTHSWLGLTVVETVRGLEVSYVLPGEAAARAGIELGDIITSVYGVAVNTLEEVHEILIDLEPDTLINVGWKRDRNEYSGVLSLERRPEYPIDVARERDVFTNLIAPLFGMALERTGTYFWDTSYTIKRIYPGGIADETGLSVNDPLTILGFEVDEEYRVGYLQIVVKKKKAGFIERAIQLGTYLEIDNFI
jgi:S1-C subfamily serine protease